MRIPRSLEINGKRWRVVRKPLAHLGDSGRCYPGSREIQLDPYLTREELEDTFLHELIHACLREPWATKAEERMVARLTPRLLKAMKDIGWVK
jgi:hypothetical protein